MTAKQEHSLKTVFFASTSYPKDAKDWKSVFIRQLLKALAESQEVRIGYWGPPGDVPPQVEYTCLEKETSWLTWLMNQGGVAHLLRQKESRRFFVILKLIQYLFSAYRRHGEYEIFHINWLQNAIPLWRTKKPALVTVFGNDFGLLKKPGMTTLLRYVLKRRSCVIAPNAEWMVPELKKRFGDIAHVVTIPLGIDEDWYGVIRDISFETKNQWIVVSRLTKNKIGFLFNWGEKVFHAESKHELHLFGPMQEKIQIPKWVHYHGSTYAEDLRKNWFPKATGLITLSQHDEGRPQVMLEAMASGIPIISSDIPAHKNFIISKKTGLIVNSQKEFIECIEWLSNTKNNMFISESARIWVKKEIGTWRDCAKRYIILYSFLTKGDH